MGNEFRKPYEYEEEKRGLIVLFISMILSVDILQTIFFATQEDRYLGDSPTLVIALFIIAGVFIMYTLYTSVVVFRMKSNFVVAAKRYIIIRTILFLFNFFVVFFNRLLQENLVGEEPDQYLSIGYMLYIEVFMPLFFIISLSVVWYLYFTYSKRCRNVKG